MFERDFYYEVEKLSALKHILYGDSVSKETTTVVQWKETKKRETIFFNDLWNKLVKMNLPRIYRRNKEFINIKDELKTLSYSSDKNRLKWTTPNYIVRHLINEELFKLEIDEINYLEVTSQHSLLEYDSYKNELKKILPNEANYLLEIANNSFIKKEIENNKKIAYNDYVYDWNIPETQNFVANGFLVHNTDSIFIAIPTNNVQDLSAEKRWKIAENTASDINDLIINYTKEKLLPRCNIDSENNRTFFDTELLMENIMFLDIKKNYAYKLLVKEGNVLENPKVDYKGIQVIKSDAAKMTQDLLSEMIEDVILNSNISDNQKFAYIVQIVSKYDEKFKECIKNLDLNDVAVPVKWSKDNQTINSMKIFNHIMDDEIFTFGSAGKFVYAKFQSPSYFKNAGVDMNNLNGICIPYSYDVEKLRQKLNEFKITIDQKSQWNDKIYTKTCERVSELAKKVSKSK